MCHLILILPLIGLVVFWIFPVYIAAPVYALILAYSIRFYLMVIRTKKIPVHAGKEEMLHNKVEVLDSLMPSGHVRFHNEVWNASSRDSLKKGDTAEIIGLNGLTLIVRKT